MESAQDSRWAMAEMKWTITDLISREFVDVDYVNPRKAHTGGSRYYHAGDAPRVNNASHLHPCVYGATRCNRCR